MRMVDEEAQLLWSVFVKEAGCYGRQARMEVGC